MINESNAMCSQTGRGYPFRATTVALHVLVICELENLFDHLHIICRWQCVLNRPEGGLPGMRTVGRDDDDINPDTAHEDTTGTSDGAGATDASGPTAQDGTEEADNGMLDAALDAGEAATTDGSPFFKVDGKNVSVSHTKFILAKQCTDGRTASS